MTDNGRPPDVQGDSREVDRRSVLALLDELRVIAQNGLAYGEDPHDAYDEERYERLLALTSEWYGLALDYPPEAARERLTADLGHATAKVGASAAVFDDEGRILLVKRADNGLWDLPGGFVEPNEGPETTVVRETREETGLDVAQPELVGVYSEPPGESRTHTHVVVLYRCRRTGGTMRGSHEGRGVRFWDVDAVPAWNGQNEEYARAARERWRSARKDGD